MKVLRSIVAGFLLLGGITLANVADAHERACPDPTSRSAPVSVLIVTGGHPYEPSEFFSTFAAMPNVTFLHLYLLDSQRPMSTPEGGLGQYDVVLFYDFHPGEHDVTPEWRSLLDRAGGVVFLHHAIGSFPGASDFRAIAGGRATYHPNRLQHFTITDRQHPITCGMRDFDMLDEAYGNVEIAPGAHILVTSDAPQANSAAAWTWSYNQQRVLYLQPGHGSLGLPPNHGPSSYQNESFKMLLYRGIMWAAGRT